MLPFFFLLGYGGILLGCLARGARTGVRGILLSVLIVPVYAAYSWLLWPVLARAVGPPGHRATRVDEDCARADRRPDALAPAPSSVRPVDRSRPEIGKLADLSRPAACALPAQKAARRGSKKRDP